MKGENFEIIVVDDFSDDGTEQILKRKQKKYKNLFYHLRKLPNKSLAKSILKGVSLSKKNNIIVMDSDFNHKPRDLRKLIAKFKEHLTKQCRTLSIIWNLQNHRTRMGDARYSIQNQC